MFFLIGDWMTNIRCCDCVRMGGLIGMLKRKKRSHLSIELNDYVLRAMLVKSPEDIQDVEVFEVPLERGIIEIEVIANEMALFELLKEHLVAWGGKHQNIRFCVPSSSVLMKNIDHPIDVKPENLKGYVEMELGRSIHLPFSEPLIDVYDREPGDGKAVLYAVPADEIVGFSNMLMDLQLQPEAADIRSLCNVRLLEHLEVLDFEKTYLISDWSIHELSVCIISKGEIEFLRYQGIETDLDKWNASVDITGSLNFEYSGSLDEYRGTVMNQVLEIDRMMNFFKFSLHKGEQEVDEIVVMGDNPLLSQIAGLIQDNLTTPLKVIDDVFIHERYPKLSAKHMNLLGLALKEVKA